MSEPTDEQVLQFVRDHGDETWFLAEFRLWWDACIQWPGDVDYGLRGPDWAVLIDGPNGAECARSLFDDDRLELVDGYLQLRVSDAIEPAKLSAWQRFADHVRKLVKLNERGSYELF